MYILNKRQKSWQHIEWGWFSRSTAASSVGPPSSSCPQGQPPTSLLKSLVHAKKSVHPRTPLKQDQVCTLHYAVYSFLLPTPSSTPASDKSLSSMAETSCPSGSPYAFPSFPLPNGFFNSIFCSEPFNHHWNISSKWVPICFSQLTPPQCVLQLQLLQRAVPPLLKHLVQVGPHITDFKFTGKVESQTIIFLKSSVLAHFTWNFFRNQ